MLILGIDTSTDILGLALIKNNEILGEYNLSLKRKHSEKLLPLIDQIFTNLEISLVEVEGIAVAVGPGSFTGLRIGITTAKLLGRIFSIPVKGISTLEIMAAGIEKEYILPLLDARRKRVYYSFFQNNENQNKFTLKEIKKAASARISELPEVLNKYKFNQITILGEKTAEVKKVLEKKDYIIKQYSAAKNMPRAAVLAFLGQDYINSGKKDDIYKLKPTYLKKPQAEINWQKKYGGN